MLLRPIFAEKLKTAPPPKGFGCWSCEVAAVIQAEELCEFSNSAEKSVSILVKTFFFGDHLFLGGKTVWIFDFGQKICHKPCESNSRAMKIRVKVSYSCLTLSKKAPPFSNPVYAPSLESLLSTFFSLCSSNHVILVQWNKQGYLCDVLSLLVYVSPSFIVRGPIFLEPKFNEQCGLVAGNMNW